MRHLADLFKKSECTTDARWWIGATPRGPVKDIPRLIAGQIGYPTSRLDPFVEGGLVRLNWAQAAHVLAIASTVSLAYEALTPENGWLGEARAALKEMSYDAVFFSNGYWNDREALGWVPLSSATFDCGLIGFDAENAFIFWIEEED